MNKFGLTRWRILMLALTLTIIAIFYPVDDSSENFRPETQLSTKSELKASNDSPQHETTPGEISQDTIEEAPDPFAARGWQKIVTPLPVQVSQVREVIAPPPPPEPVTAPPLPFRFLGKFIDSENLVIYLGRGDQTILARLGDTLEGNYKVLKIVDHGIELEYLPTGEKQNLSFE